VGDIPRKITIAAPPAAVYSAVAEQHYSKIQSTLRVHQPTR
jgi:hypothetical protein